MTTQIEDIIPEDVRQFILRNISCVAQMEALLLLRADPQLTWDDAAIVRRLYIDRKEAETLLSEMKQRGFLAANGSSYRYAPQTPELSDMLERVADFYKRYLLPVTHLIHSRSKSRVQEFADAFRIRKD